MNKIIFPLNPGMEGGAVADLQDALLFLLAKGVFHFNDAQRTAAENALRIEREPRVFRNNTKKLVSIFQETHPPLQVNGTVDERTADALNALLKELGALEPGHNEPGHGEPEDQRRVEGEVRFDDGRPAEQLSLRLVRIDFGGDAKQISETVTREGGAYALPFDLGGKPAGLEIRALDAAGKEVPLSKPLYDLGEEPSIAVHLIAPASLQPLAAEYRRLADALTPLVGGDLKNLAKSHEGDGRNDLTVLNRATGWDARLIALMALTERLAADGMNLMKEGLYGLLRAGLPSEELPLARVEPDVVERALQHAREAGIVALTDEQLAQFKKEFAAFAAGARLGIAAPGSTATYGDLLAASGLKPETRDKFASVFLGSRGTGPQLWEAARNAGLETTDINRLQLQGKFAFLAGNSQAMTERLLQKRIQEKPIQNPEELVALDFHRADQWKAEAQDAVGGDVAKLAELIPMAYTGEKVEDRLDAYAADMARKVRLSYPTQVVGRMIERNEIKLPGASEAERSSTLKLMKQASAQGFKLGQTPAKSFLKSRPSVVAVLDEKERPAAEQSLRLLQRAYQITPSNEAMTVMMELKITSAFDVMAHTETDFKDLYMSKYIDIWKVPPTPDEPRMIYRKAQQVSCVTYNVFSVAKRLASEPSVAAFSPSVEVRESVRDGLLKQIPTLESLFGSMDYCECEHCRSVLSPAAYFVDLLQFLDIEDSAWATFLETWAGNHGAEYMKDWDKKPDNSGRTPEERKPYDALIERRPDLPHVALTCENTNTALPYIDIVNEILEYYVANGKLAADAVHETRDVTTEELLAEPQNVIRETYDGLCQARYPLNLPFDLWSETVRQFCNYFETPLHEVLETFRPKDDLFAPAQTFDRAAIFQESLGLSPAEVAILTDPDPLAKWHELYGFASVADATTEATDATTGQRIDLNSAKALSRRLGATYKEIADIVQTGFVNPELSKVSLLYKLDVGVRDAKLYKDEKAFYEGNKDFYEKNKGKNRSDLTPADQLRYDDLATKRPNREITGWQILDELAACEERLTDLAATFKPPLNVDNLRAAIQAIPFNQVLVLADPDAGCNFDLTTLQYADGTKADPIVFLRINLFVRLWRKLGWSIEETDRALTSFVPLSAPFDGTAANLAKQPLKTTLIYLAHLKALDEKLKVGKQSRLKLLTLWSNIPTTGKKPLYAQLFLNRTGLKSSPLFDHPLGQYLTDLTIKLKDHMLALQGALGLTADEISRILVDAGKSFDSAELSLANVSQLYRYGLLAKALKLSVRELITLKQLSNLDPFKALHPDPLANLGQDYPFSQTLEFVKVAEEIKDSELKIEDLDYLLRHRFDETGKYRPEREGTLVFLKSLSEGIRAIRAEHSVPADAGGLSEEVLRQKLGLALPPDVVERLLGMVNTTAEFTATKSGVNAADQLKPSDLVSDERIREVSYKEVPQKEEKLTVRGVLFDPTKTAMKASFDAVLTAAQKQAFAELLDAVQKLAREFFDNQLKRQKLRLDGEAGFLEDADFATLFAPLEPPKKVLPTDSAAEVDFKRGENEKIDKKNQEELQTRRYRIAQVFLPFLQQRLIGQFIVQMMTARAGADPVLVESFIADDRLLAAPEALLDVFAATGERGVNATFWASADATGDALPGVSLPDADTGAKDKVGKALKPAGADSARLEAYLEVPAAGAYRFYIELDRQNAEAELRFQHLPEPVLVKGKANADHATLGDQPNEYLELKAGVLYHFSLDLKHLNGGNARLIVQGETLPKGPLSQLPLYPAVALEAGERATTLLSKALQLVQSMGMSEREIRYVLTHAADFDNLSMSELPTATVGDAAAEVTATAQRFGRFRRLAAYARLKRNLAGGTDDLIGIFEAYGTTAGDRLEKLVYPLIAKLTRRDDATVKASAEALIKAPAVPTFESEKPLLRLWEALKVIESFGVPPGSLLGWAGIVNSATTGERRFEIARDLKEAIKARFELETWRRVAQPIFDKLRQRQRDALVAYIIHRKGFERLEQLYEYFLVDPGMEPVVQTSRLRLAIGSVQLFIQRCLLNLEPHVHPSRINARHWDWMKRYRVWEANRKIFLFPENWLEPEFRDDKTHLFAELEGALLQGDVSRDLVEDAFLTYLKKLDELARLDIVGLHVESSDDGTSRILHVIGRTYSQPHKYFYRRCAREMWTPWEPMDVEIEGDHLAPVIWRDRLYLFWVTFLEKGPQKSPISTIDPTKAIAIPDVKKDIEAHLHWSEYLEGEWSASESSSHSVPSPIILTDQTEFDRNSVFIHVSKEMSGDEERGVQIHLGGKINASFYIAGRNSPPERKDRGTEPENKFVTTGIQANRYSGDDELDVSFKERIITGPGAALATASAQTIIKRKGKFTLLPCDNHLNPLGVPNYAYEDAADPAAVKAALESGIAEIAALMRPVFYQDNSHTFFVEPTVAEQTIEDWQDWVVPTLVPDPGWAGPNWWGKDFVAVADHPWRVPIPDPGDPWRDNLDRNSIRELSRSRDWLVNPLTALKFDGELIGPRGLPGLEVGTPGALAEGLSVNVSAGSALGSGETVAVRDSHALANSGLTRDAASLNIVGVGGFNAALLQNLKQANLGAGMAGIH